MLKKMAFGVCFFMLLPLSGNAQSIPEEFHGKWKIATATDCSTFAIIEAKEYTTDSDWGMSEVKAVEPKPDNSLDVKGVESYSDEGEAVKTPNKINLKLEKGLLSISGEYHKNDFSETYIKCTKEDDEREADASMAREENQSNEAPKDRWVVFSNNDKAVQSFDSESIARGSIWVRVIAKSKRNYFKGARTTLFNYEFLCSMHSGGISTAIGFSSNGNKIFSDRYPLAMTTRIEPESLNESLYMIACK